jgi:hypothetical protein
MSASAPAADWSARIPGATGEGCFPPDPDAFYRDDVLELLAEVVETLEDNRPEGMLWQQRVEAYTGEKLPEHLS